LLVLLPHQEKQSQETERMRRGNEMKLKFWWEHECGGQ
jgi:hypothetical protein